MVLFWQQRKDDEFTFRLAGFEEILGLPGKNIQQVEEFGCRYHLENYQNIGDREVVGVNETLPTAPKKSMVNREEGILKAVLSLRMYYLGQKPRFKTRCQVEGLLKGSQSSVQLRLR